MFQLCSIKSQDSWLQLKIILFLAANCFLGVQSCCPVPQSSPVAEALKQNGPESCAENQIFFEETGECYLFTENPSQENGNPCGANMLFQRQVNDPRRGRCDCELQQSRIRPLMYDRRTKQCYYVLTRGPCRVGQWIELTNGVPKCVTNPCANVSLDDDIVLLNGTCVTLDSSCKSPNNKKGVVEFTGKPYPECVPISFRSLGAVESLRCPDHTYRTLDGKGCQSPIDFDFD